MRRIFNSLLVIGIMFLASCEGDFEAKEYVYDRLSVYETTAYFDGSNLIKGAAINGASKIIIPYKNYEDRNITFTTEAVSLPDGVTLQESVVALSKVDGEMEVCLYGSPEKADSYTFNFYLNCDDNQWLVRVENIDVYDNVDAPNLRNVKLTGPIFDDPALYSETYKLSFQYRNVESGYTFQFAGTKGYLEADPDFIEANLSSYTFEVTPLNEGVWSETQEYDLPDGTLSTSTDFSNLSGADFPQYDAWIGVVMTYNSLNISTDENATDYDYSTDYAGFVTTGLTVKGMRYDGILYSTIEPGDGRRWMDRNVGATSIAQPPIVMNGTSVDDSWISNIDTYGYYYLALAETGVPIIMDGNNTIINSSAYYYGVRDTSGTLIDASKYPNIPYFSRASSGGWSEYYSASGISLSITDDTFDAALNSTEDGGTANPCPPGYRVPTRLEVLQMIDAVVGGIASIDANYTSVEEYYYRDDTDNTSKLNAANSVLIGALITKMNFGLSGYIDQNGPTDSSATSGSGQVGMVGLPQACASSMSSTFGYVKPSAGRILIRTCDHLTDSYAKGLALTPVEIASTGTVFTTNDGFSSNGGQGYGTGGANQSCNRNYSAFPTRCIKHQ